MQPSDKIISGYWDRYLEVFAGCEFDYILELGVLEGASLELWSQEWPGAHVVGIDRDPPVCEPGGAWKTFRCEQADQTLLRQISEAEAPHGWDLIVDDASHEGDLTMASFDALWPTLRSNGVYVIEDWGTGYWPGWPDHGSGHSMVDMIYRMVDGIDGSGAGMDLGIRHIEIHPGQCFVWKS